MALYSLRKVSIGGGSGDEIVYPWDLNVSRNGSITSVTIIPGNINNFVPSNMFETIQVGNASQLFVKLACSTNGQVITDVIIYINANPAVNQTPTNSALPSYFEYTVGLISSTGVGYNLAKKLLTAVGSRLYLTDKSTPAGPGEMAYEEWLVWSIS